MNLRDVLRLFVNRLPDPWTDDDERLREAEQRVNVLDATIGAQRAQRDKDRHQGEREGQRASR